MNPLLLLGGLLLTQLAAVWVLMAVAWNLALPGWLFPVTGRWRVYLALGYLALTFPGPAVIAFVMLASTPAGSDDILPQLGIVWLIVDGLCIGFLALLIKVVFVMVGLPGDPPDAAAKGKAFLPRGGGRSSR